LRTFFLFYLLSSLLRSPLLALLIVGAVVYLSEARYRGRYFNPGSFMRQRNTLRELSRSLEINDHDVAAHNDLGRLLADQGKYEEAAEHMAKAIRRMEESPETNYYHGLCLLKTGHEEEGREFIRTALKINPRFLYGVPQTVLARDFLEHGDNEKAVEWAEAAVKLNTSNVEGFTILGQARDNLGDKQGAIEAYKGALEAYRHLPHYLRLANRGWAKQAKKSGVRS